MRGASLDIVIPARGEDLTLQACLESIAADAAGLDLRTIVVANGPERAGSVAAAHRLAPRLASAGVDFRVVEEPVAGKTGALNRGDAERRAGPVLYLDADMVLAPGSLVAITRALADDGAPRLVAPPLRLAPPRHWLTRGFATVWMSLPAVEGQIVGGGGYAVNGAGRARWGRFPDVIADDAYVRSCFGPGEWRVLEDGGCVVTLPEGWRLVRTAARWRAGNRQLRALADGSAGGRDPRGGRLANLRRIGGRPHLWPSVPAFALVWLGARLSPWRGSASDWTPVRQPDSALLRRARR